MDGRHEFILSTVSERLGMKQEDAEEFMLDGAQVSPDFNDLQIPPHGMPLLFNKQLVKFEDFFASDGRPDLTFFYRPPLEKESDVVSTSHNANGKLLWIADSGKEEYTGTCLFFLRTNTSKPITMMNIHQVTTIAKIPCAIKL